MARGGINLAVVQKARNSLLVRGVYPSIDAVRVEIGNTGSKTTIARYLKQLEAPGADAAPRERMSAALRDVVETLLDQVQEEGDQAFLEARAEFEHERKLLVERAETLENQLAELQRQFDAQGTALAAQIEELKVTHSSLQSELTRNAAISQQCTDLQVRLRERDEQIRSLEEKHVHARGALEHYRESVKEQRDQDQRRHEAQLHQVQVENRRLQESLVVKQDESTRLNRDNERLLGEARQQSKELRSQRDQLLDLTAQAQQLRSTEAGATAKTEHLQGQVADQAREIKALSVAMALAEARENHLVAQLATANDLLEMQQSSVADARDPTPGGISSKDTEESQL
ncbi:DNA-binding protein [Pseudomonas rhodesiae]|uniref:DNA-binding protein n=1 Tax=Pseudomonas rhodesiae TaxID=76760 RepID=UPI001F22A721|nr:DNA-binding protein [Pseudomonas rhodesiae]